MLQVITSASVGQGGTGVAFFDSKNGILAASDGIGYNIYVSADGGATWPTKAPNSDAYIFGLYDSAASGSNAVVAGDTLTQFTNNKAQFFNTSSGGAGGGAAYNIGSTGGFAIVGEFGSSSTPGVAVSTDGGATFNTIDASSALTMAPGYGWFVDANNWYVTAFTAPAPPSDQPTTGTGSTTGGGTSTGGGSTAAESSVGYFRKRVSTRVALVGAEGVGAKHVFDYAAPAHGRGLQSTGSYGGQIIKTTNGGSAWTSVYTQNLFELNGIACQDANHCVAVGADDAATYIITTANGGSTWNTTFNSTAAGVAAGAELIDVRAVGGNTYWAVGGIATSSSLSATFYKSTDNGNTWTQDTEIDNYFATGIECNVAASAYTCWSTIQDSNGNTFIASASS